MILQYQQQQSSQKRMIGPSINSYVQSSSEDVEEQLEEKLQIQIQPDRQESNQNWHQLGIPVDAFATLKGHNKAVSCCVVQPKGHRMATGGLDYHVRLWDFHGMNKNMNSFRIVQPFTGNAIRNLSFNLSGTHLMIINGNKQITFLDKDGARNLLTVKGYMYVKDLNLTKGHTNTVYDGHFHPINSNQFVTASADGSIRMWDIEQKLQGIEQELAHKTLLRTKDQRGAYIGIQAVSYSKDGKMIIGGCLDGSLQVFSTKRNLHRPEHLIREAHHFKEEFTSIVGFQDNYRIATRNTDGTLKVWDLRKFTRPIFHQRNLPNRFPGNKLCFSPDNRFLLVGTAVGPEIEEKNSFVHFYDTTTMKRVKSLFIGDSSVCGLTWSPAINQIVVGTANGEARIYFDERLSRLGALKAINKQPRVDKDPKLGYSAPVYLPFGLPLYKQKMTNNAKRDILDIRKDPLKSQRPLFPKQGPHKQGRQNDKAYNYIQHMIQSLAANPEKVEDARKPLWELQKYSKEKQQFTEAYQFTQPQPIYHQSPQDTKQFQFLQTIEKICPHCGLKLCTCIRNNVYDQQDEQDSQEKEVQK